MFKKIRNIKDYKNVNELLDYFNVNHFNMYKDKIDLDRLSSVDVFIEVFSERILNNQINIDNTITILSSFMESYNDEQKIKIFISILEKIYMSDNFVNAYNNDAIYQFPISYELSEEKFNLLIDIFMKILKYCTNKLSNDILKIIIYNLSMDVVLEEEYKKVLIDIMNEKLLELRDGFDNKKNVISDNLLVNYSLFVELSKYISDTKTEEIIKDISISDLPNEIKLKMIEVMILKEIKFSENIIRTMFDDVRNGYNTLLLLERLNARKLLPDNLSITQEEIVIIQVDEWLKFYSGMQCEPVDLKIIDSVVIDNYRYYVLSFKDLNNEDSEKVMIVLSQGYKDGIITTSGLGEEYSEFEEFSDNYKEQVGILLKSSKE